MDTTKVPASMHNMHWHETGHAVLSTHAIKGLDHQTKIENITV